MLVLVVKDKLYPIVPNSSSSSNSSSRRRRHNSKSCSCSSSRSRRRRHSSCTKFSRLAKPQQVADQLSGSMAFNASLFLSRISNAMDSMTV